jgi:hypothetical protein
MSPKRPTDVNVRAKLIADIVVGKKKRPEDLDGKNKASQAIGRMGGAKGGRLRAQKLTPERRQEIAKEAAQKRWEN